MWILASALQYADVNGYSALILRRTFTDLNLPGALMDVAHEWLGDTGARWDDRSHTWSFPSGATLTFGYLKTEKDKYRYQSSHFQFVGFDELTQFTKSQYTYLFSRARRVAGIDIPVRVRSASNPGGEGHDWVFKRFIDPDLKEPDSLFIPALLEDNPFLDQEEYEVFLSKLDPVTQAQLRWGDWLIKPQGNLFQRAWFGEPLGTEPKKLKRRVRFWDLASTEVKEGKDPDYTAGVLMGKHDDGTYTVLHTVTSRDSPGAIETLIKQTAMMDGKDVWVRIEEEPGSSGAFVSNTFVRQLDGYDVAGLRSTGSKIERARPLSAQVYAGNVRLVSGYWNREFLDQVTPFPQEGLHDDIVDAFSGAYYVLSEEPIYETYRAPSPFQ